MSTSSSAAPERQEQHEGARNMNTELDENVAATLSYVLGWITGIAMYLLEPDNESIRFHAVQSIVVFGGFSVLVFGLGVFSAVISGLAFAGGAVGIVFGVFSIIIDLINLVVWLAGFGLWVYLILRTYQEQEPRVPGAEGIVKKIIS